jgi:hypothetical protein
MANTDRARMGRSAESLTQSGALQLSQRQLTAHDSRSNAGMAKSTPLCEIGNEVSLIVVRVAVSSTLAMLFLYLMLN